MSRTILIGQSYPYQGTTIRVLDASPTVGVFVEAQDPVPCELGSGGPRRLLTRFWIRARGRIERRAGLRYVFVLEPA